MTTKQITSITVFWDSQDPSNEGWAYRAATGTRQERDSYDEGPIDSVAADDLDGTIAEACRVLAVDLTPDQFDREPELEGGHAIWSAAE